MIAVRFLRVEARFLCNLGGSVFWRWTGLSPVCFHVMIAWLILKTYFRIFVIVVHVHITFHLTTPAFWGDMTFLRWKLITVEKCLLTNIPLNFINKWFSRSLLKKAIGFSQMLGFLCNYYYLMLLPPSNTIILILQFSYTETIPADWTAQFT